MFILQCVVKIMLTRFQFILTSFRHNDPYSVLYTAYDWRTMAADFKARVLLSMPDARQRFQKSNRRCAAKLQGRARFVEKAERCSHLKIIIAAFLSCPIVLRRCALIEPGSSFISQTSSPHPLLVLCHFNSSFPYHDTSLFNIFSLPLLLIFLNIDSPPF